MIDSTFFKKKLITFEEQYKFYSSKKQENIKNFDSDSIRYFEFAREAVNEKQAREYRGNIVSKFINESTVTLNTIFPGGYVKGSQEIANPMISITVSCLLNTGH